MLSAEGVNVWIFIRCPSGTRFEFTTSTATVPIPSPRTWTGVVALALRNPGTRGLGRTRTTFLGSTNPPRGVPVTAIAFCDGYTRNESNCESTPKS